MKTWLDLTDSFPLKFDANRMLEEIRSIDRPDWLSHYDAQLSTGWRGILLVSKHGQMSGPESQRPTWDFSEFKRTQIVADMPYFRSILDYFQTPLGRVRILKLSPGASIKPHRDIGAEAGCLAFKQVRLHVPIITNPKVSFWVDGERIEMKPGRFYYANFSKTHAVENAGDIDRIHLVIDLKVNDWMRQFFPPTSLWEESEYAFARATWPIFWAARGAWIQGSGKAWARYEGSVAQRCVHKFKDVLGISHSPLVKKAN